MAPTDDDSQPDVTLTASAILAPHAGPSAPVPFPARVRARYVFEGEHARGGLGRIVKAIDRDLGRVVAIKELISTDDQSIERFAREARITASLEHPSIVPVHDLGEWGPGEPFYAMKLVSGRTLKDLVAESKAEKGRIGLVPHVLAVAEAIAYAHNRRVLHRDLKPSNVLVGEFGETVVVDWGLAKAIDAEELPVDAGVYRTAARSDLTGVGAIIGTPAYMPPEQARGENVDERADVYSLGAMLYHVLAGKPPYRGDDSRKLLELVLEGPPPRLESSIPQELVAIVDRAMARDPAERYRNAGGFAADLKRHVTGQLVEAHSYRLRDLIRRWVLRHRALIFISVAFASALALIGAVGFLRVLAAKREATRERAVAEARRLDAEQARTSAEQRSAQLVLAQARAELDHDPTAALAWVASYPSSGPETALARTIAADALARGAADLAFHGVDASNLAVAADDRTVALLTEDGRAYAFDIGTSVATPLLIQPSRKNPFVWSPSGSWLLTTNIDGTVSLLRRGQWSVRTLAPLTQATDRYAAFSWDSTRVAVADADGALTVWDVDSGRKEWEGASTEGTLGVAFSLDGTKLLVVNRMSAEEFDLRTSRRQILLTSKLPLHQFVTSADGRVAAASFGPSVFVIDLDKMAARQLIADRARLTVFPTGGYSIDHLASPDPISHSTSVTAMTLSPDGRVLVSSADADGVRVWDVARGSHFDLPRFTDHARAMLFSDDGRYLVIERDDRQVSRWLRTGETFRHEDDLRLSGEALQDLAVSRSGDRLLSIDDSGQLRQWTDHGRSIVGRSLLSWVSDTDVVYEGTDGELYLAGLGNPTPTMLPTCRRGRGPGDRRLHLAASASVVACIDDGGLVSVVDLGSRQRTTLDEFGPATGLWVNGTRILIRLADGRLELRDHATNAATSMWIERPVVAENGVAVASTDGEHILVWNTVDLSEWTVDAPSPTEIWLLDEGRTVAWTSRDGAFHVRPLAAAATTTLQESLPSATPLAISPDGRHLLVSEKDRGASVWDSILGGRLYRLPPIDHGVARFLDDKRLVVASGEKLLLVDADHGTYRTAATAKRPLLGVDLSKNGDVMAWSQDGTTTIVDPESITPRVLPGEDWAFSARFSPEGDRVASEESGAVIHIRPDDLPHDGALLAADLKRRSKVAISARGDLVAPAFHP